MKASIKFREDQKPLLRAKIPLNVLSLPFQSGIVAGESKELSLNLGTFFESGPAFKIAYRPNDSQNPFSFVCKTGIGHFGSPISSPFTMSAEFNFMNQNPAFFIHFKPNFGDFSIKKSQSSSGLVKKIEPELNGGVSGEETSSARKNGFFEESGLFPGAGKIAVLPVESVAAAKAASGMMESVFSGTEVSARTALPLRNHAVVNFRWGLRAPPAAVEDGPEDAVLVGKKERMAGISFRKFPMLLMDKISIEHMAKGYKKNSKVGSDLNSAGSVEVAEACLNVKKQLETIQTENGLLRKALNDLRSDIATGKMNLVGGADIDVGKHREGDRHGNKYSGGGSRGDRRGNGGGNGDKKSSEINGKAMEVDVN